MHDLYLIAGRTGCGKSSISHKVANQLGLKILKSYTTRKQRESELLQSDHIFINEDEFRTYLHDIVAYTEINDNKYFSTKQQLFDSDIYVIDYEGIKYLKEQHLQDLNLIVIYIYCEPDIRRERYLARDNTDIHMFNERNQSEFIQFCEMERFEDYQYIIDNTDDMQESINQLIKIIRK